MVISSDSVEFRILPSLTSNSTSARDGQKLQNSRNCEIDIDASSLIAEY
jgi:hypothetical protein